MYNNIDYKLNIKERFKECKHFGVTVIAIEVVK